MRDRPIYWKSLITGALFPYFNTLYNDFPEGVKRYANIGDQSKEPSVYDLPGDSTICTLVLKSEYEEKKVQRRFNIHSLEHS